MSGERQLSRQHLPGVCARIVQFSCVLRRRRSSTDCVNPVPQDDQTESVSCRIHACTRGPIIRPWVVGEALLLRAHDSTALPDEVAVDDRRLVVLLRSRRRLSLGRPTLRRDVEGLYCRLRNLAAKDVDGVAEEDGIEVASGVGHAGQSCPDSVSQTADILGVPARVGPTSQAVDIAGVSYHLNKGRRAVIGRILKSLAQ